MAAANSFRPLGAVPLISILIVVLSCFAFSVFGSNLVRRLRPCVNNSVNRILGQSSTKSRLFSSLDSSRQQNNDFFKTFQSKDNSGRCHFGTTTISFRGDNKGGELNCSANKGIDFQNIKSGYLQDKTAAYVLSEPYPISFTTKSNNIATLVWIPGGGISSLAFAFSGVGPLEVSGTVESIDKKSESAKFPRRKRTSSTILHGHDQIEEVASVRPNPNALQLPQLFLAASEWPPYLEEDELVKKYVNSIIELAQKQAFPGPLVLCGVSYGGKLAVKIRERLLEIEKISEKESYLKKLLDNVKISNTVIGITPFLDPFHSMAYIPEPVLRKSNFVLPPNDSLSSESICETLANLRLDFSEALHFAKETGHLSGVEPFLDEQGYFSDFVRFQLLSPHLHQNSPLNMWDVSKLREPTGGSGSEKDSVFKLFGDIRDVLKNPCSYLRDDALEGLYSEADNWVEKILGDDTNKHNFPLINPKAWTTLQKSGGYCTSDLISDIREKPENKDLKLLAFAGMNDVICSWEGLNDLAESVNLPTRDINFVAGEKGVKKVQEKMNVVGVCDAPHLLLPMKNADVLRRVIEGAVSCGGHGK